MAENFGTGELKCDCGYISSFTEQTINAMEELSKRKEESLLDDSHRFFFKKGKLHRAEKYSRQISQDKK